MRMVYPIIVINNETDDEVKLELDINREEDVCDIVLDGKVIASADWSGNIVQIFEEIINIEKKLAEL